MYNSLLPKAELERILEMNETVTKSFKPVIQMMQNPTFQAQMQEINRIAENIRKSVEQSRAFTLPIIRQMEELYGTIDKVSEEIAPAYSIPESKREEVITRSIYSETKLIIKKGIPSLREIIPLSLPKSTQWEDVQVRFHDPHTVFIKIPKYEAKITADYKDMGMEDLRSHLPNAQWKVLQALARYKDGISWKTPVASPTIKKNKQLLAEALKRYFNIDDDPFFLYKKEKTYRLKMRLIPDEVPQEKDQFGVQGYFNEQAPEVYDRRELYNLYDDDKD
jgi:hypothetical protein